MNRNWSVILLASVLLLTCGAVESHFKSTVAPSLVKETQFSKVTRDRPWRFPGGNQFAVLETRSEEIAGVPIQETIFRFPAQEELPLADVEFYYLLDGQLHIGTDLLALQNLSSYSLNGQPFAYRAKYCKVVLNADGSRKYYGAVFMFYYYDETGDGTFKTRYDHLSRLKLPDWYQG
jgi:hypothetical protein